MGDSSTRATGYILCASSPGLPKTDDRTGSVRDFCFEVTFCLVIVEICHQKRFPWLAISEQSLFPLSGFQDWKQLI